MSKLSEIYYEGMADDLLQVLEKAKSQDNPAVLDFCRTNLYPLWEFYKGEVLRRDTLPEKEISDFFEKL